MNIQDVDISDCRQMTYNQHNDLIAVAGQNEANGLNLKNIIEEERALFYDWGQQHYNFSRGRALIFHDNQNHSHLLELAKCFKDLDYKVKLSAVRNIENDIGNYFFFAVFS